MTHIKTLAKRIDAVLQPRVEGAMPLVKLIHLLGYHVPGNKPFGHSDQRKDVMGALALLAQGSKWQIVRRDMSEEPCPLGLPAGYDADPTWFLFSRPVRRYRRLYRARTVWSTDLHIK